MRAPIVLRSAPSDRHQATEALRSGPRGARLDLLEQRMHVRPAGRIRYNSSLSSGTDRCTAAELRATSDSDHGRHEGDAEAGLCEHLYQWRCRRSARRRARVSSRSAEPGIYRNAERRFGDPAISGAPSSRPEVSASAPLRTFGGRDEAAAA